MLGKADPDEPPVATRVSDRIVSTASSTPITLLRAIAPFPPI
jgi:hypothetical protein